MAKTVWRDEFIVRVYSMSREGMSERKIAKLLGIAFVTFVDWEKKKPLFKMALQMGRKEYKNNGKLSKSFGEFVYGRLPKDLKILWKKINRLDSAKTGVEKKEALLEGRGVHARQYLFFYAWTASNFSVSKAMRKVNISRGTFELWKKDPQFHALVKEIDFYRKNFAEDCMFRLVAGGDTSATIALNKAINRDRGFGDKIDMNVIADVTQNVVSIDSTDLTLKEKKRILESLRANKNDNG